MTTAVVHKKKKKARAARARAGDQVRAELLTARGSRATVELKVLAELDLGETIVRAFSDALTRGLLGR